jgi:hypothetical protein
VTKGKAIAKVMPDVSEPKGDIGSTGPPGLSWAASEAIAWIEDHIQSSQEGCLYSIRLFVAG